MEDIKKIATPPSEKALEDIAVSYIEDKFAIPGMTIFFYEELEGDREDDLAYKTVAESMPRSDESCDKWAELTDLTILDYEVSERDDEHREYTVTVIAEVTWVSYSGEDKVDEETGTQEYFVAIQYSPEGELYIDRVDY